MLTLNLNILWTVVNILVLFVLLRKFLYRPVMNVIEQRQKQIDDAIADAEGKKNDAQAVLAQAQDKLQNVDTEAAQRREAYEKQAEVEKQRAAIAADRKSQVGTGDRSERIRTYNFPQGRVSDHRIGLTLYKIEQIMNGALDEVIDALITADTAEKLKAESDA